MIYESIYESIYEILEVSVFPSRTIDTMKDRVTMH